MGDKGGKKDKNKVDKQKKSKQENEKKKKQDKQPKRTPQRKDDSNMGRLHFLYEILT